MNTLGERIESVILKSTKKKKEMALLIGIHPNTITDWIQNKKEPGINKIKLLAQHTGCDLNWLITGDDDMVMPSIGMVREPSAPYNAKEESPWMQRLIDNLNVNLMEILDLLKKKR